ncbi:MAG: peptidoglycan DD-metalloendopeptidase family protein [Gammaproteobacteria bacterium]|nr:peptidoglycan DD-metalloendopeptidase family protein [Gammaproteobacteria bacterium]
MKLFIHIIGIIFAASLLASCINPAAVNYKITDKGSYRVKQGDTLYSIAWRYGLDYKKLATWNHIDESFTIHPGQRLLLLEPSGSTQQPGTVVQTKTDLPIQVPETTADTHSDESKIVEVSKSPGRWLWPTEGKVLSTYSAKELDRRGIDIAGTLGQGIQAVANGKVVYSGNGLAGYGNLIIIKHSETYLSAYAYNQERLVKEGMMVTAGEDIAKMGKHKTGAARLHFQIRKNGKPVDPLRFLPKR